MDIAKGFVEKLKDLMQERELNSKKLAATVGIDATSISKWLTYTKMVSLRQLILLADYFGCSIDYLVGRSDIYLGFTPQPSVPFSKSIRRIMLEKGYTRYSFTKQTRFTDAHIYQWDKGSIPKFPTLVELADLFDCSIDYLIGRE